MLARRLGWLVTLRGCLSLRSSSSLSTLVAYSWLFQACPLTAELNARMLALLDRYTIRLRHTGVSFSRFHGWRDSVSPSICIWPPAPYAPFPILSLPSTPRGVEVLIW